MPGGRPVATRPVPSSLLRIALMFAAMIMLDKPNAVARAEGSA